MFTNTHDELKFANFKFIQYIRQSAVASMYRSSIVCNHSITNAKVFPWLHHNNNNHSNNKKIGFSIMLTTYSQKIVAEDETGGEWCFNNFSVRLICLNDKITVTLTPFTEHNAT